MKKGAWGILILLCLCSSTLASQLTGEGCASDRNTALKYALADLSSKIYVNVKSQLIIKSSSSEKGYGESIFQNISLESTMPVIGYEVSYKDDCAIVYLNPHKKWLYLSEIEHAVNHIDMLYKTAQTVESDKQKLEIYNLIIKKLTEYSNLLLITEFLEVDHSIKPIISEAEAETEILKIKHNASDIPQIAENIKAQLAVKNYNMSFVSLPDNSVTPFSSALTSELKKGIKPGNYDDTLICRYTPSTPYFTVICALKGPEGVIKETAFTNVNGKICDSIDCLSYINYFKNTEKLNYSKFWGHFYSNYGTDPVVLRDGDIIRLYIRINAPSEFILIHKSENGESTILAVNGKIVHHVTSAALNTEIPAAVLKASPPYGMESITLIAFQGDIAKALDIQNSGKNEVINSNNLKNSVKEKYFESTLLFLIKP